MADDDLDSLYQQTILDHARAPRHFERPARPTLTAEGDNPMCGDRVEVFLSIGPDGRVEEACFTGRGCAISIASASLMTEVLQDKPAAELPALLDAALRMIAGPLAPEPRGSPDDHPELATLAALAGVRHFPSRLRCATLAWTTLAEALPAAWRKPDPPAADAHGPGE